MKSITLLAAACALTACGPEIRCNIDGTIIIPETVTGETAIEWHRRNIDLHKRRLAKMDGGEGRWQTPQSLEKAKGCP
jgi:hypothetical protein